MQIFHVRTWEDIEEKYPQYKKDIEEIGATITYAGPKIFPKIIATYKIGCLIDMGYGGLLKDEEWKYNPSKIYSIRQTLDGNIITTNSLNCTKSDRCFISFRSFELAEEFMKHESNRKLVEMFYMV